MANVRQVVGPKVPLTTASLAALPSGSYALSATKSNVANQPSDLFLELSVTAAGNVSSSKQAVVFAQASLDDNVYQTGANAADEAVMTRLGSLPLPTGGGLQTGYFTVAAAYGGVLPPYTRFVIKNDSGATFNGGSLSVAEVSLAIS